MDYTAVLGHILGDVTISPEKHDILLALLEDPADNHHVHEIQGLQQQLKDRDNEAAARDDLLRESRLALAVNKRNLSDREEHLAEVQLEVRRLRRSAEKEKDEHRRIEREVVDCVFKQKKKIKSLESDLARLQDAQEEQDTVITLATSFQERAHAERTKLREIIAQREARIATLTQNDAEARTYTTTLTEKIYNLTHAVSWDATTPAALEAQATLHLNLVKRLQADLGDRETALHSLQERLAFVEREVGGKLVGGMHQQLARLKEEIVAVEQARLRAANKAAELQQLADEQQALIRRLMAQSA
ncbi:hypothetical protein LTR62_008790 [Meristemomyces frigidus]|uniref:Uncharacterized protein n=1 Tax=Meristemomyces frigidus TaxID=1508187 RepID=A0AAN7TKI9_9PEZI|nr:hypothetical protein LTR62_008790 [Meristemomyces frigidus]